jgi:hypothetical protein
MAPPPGDRRPHAGAGGRECRDRRAVLIRVLVGDTALEYDVCAGEKEGIALARGGACCADDEEPAVTPRMDFKLRAISLSLLGAEQGR